VVYDSFGRPLDMVERYARPDLCVRDDHVPSCAGWRLWLRHIFTSSTDMRHTRILGVHLTSGTSATYLRQSLSTAFLLRRRNLGYTPKSGKPVAYGSFASSHS